LLDALALMVAVAGCLGRPPRRFKGGSPRRQASQPARRDGTA
jgi:hypothetical protein